MRQTSTCQRFKNNLHKLNIIKNHSSETPSTKLYVDYLCNLWLNITYFVLRVNIQVQSEKQEIMLLKFASTLFINQVK